MNTSPMTPERAAEEFGRLVDEYVNMRGPYLTQMYTQEQAAEARAALFAAHTHLLRERDEARADAGRYRWLKGRLYSLDADYGEESACVITFEWPSRASVSMNLDLAIDTARADLLSDGRAD